MNRIGHHGLGEIRENPEAIGVPFGPVVFMKRQRYLNEDHFVGAAENAHRILGPLRVFILRKAHALQIICLIPTSLYELWEPFLQ